jgi:hypothetical protein
LQPPADYTRSAHSFEAVVAWRLLGMGARALHTRGNPLHLIFAVELHLF